MELRADVVPKTAENFRYETVTGGEFHDMCVFLFEYTEVLISWFFLFCVCIFC